MNRLVLRKKMSGFTLIEVMVVVVILAILAAMIVPKIMSRPEQAKMTKTKEDVLALENALEMYKLDNGFYPSTDQGLQSLIVQPTTPPVPEHWQEGGYVKRLDNDPWSNPYQYLNPGVHGEIDVFSFGPTGKQNSASESNYIGNWNDK
jgi:general secretion pathway protein G